MRRLLAGVVNGMRFPRIGRHGLQIQPLKPQRACAFLGRLRFTGGLRRFASV